MSQLLPCSLLHSALVELMKRSGQSSYRRRWPGEHIINEVNVLINDLQQTWRLHPDTTSLLLDLSTAEELRLNYTAAIKYLKEYINRTNNHQDKSLQTKLAKYNEYSLFWRQLGMSPYDLYQLGVSLKKQYSATDLSETIKWLHSNNITEDKVLFYMKQHEIFTDLMLLDMVVE